MMPASSGPDGPVNDVMRPRVIALEVTPGAAADASPTAMVVDSRIDVNKAAKTATIDLRRTTTPRSPGSDSPGQRM
jgi:hypothetical protein